MSVWATTYLRRESSPSPPYCRSSLPRVAEIASIEDGDSRESVEVCMPATFAVFNFELISLQPTQVKMVRVKREKLRL
jgi:hypothetical protein